MARSAQDFKAAIDSMFRIRAVESPPDANGMRTIWHRGTRGAELVTQVDATGRVAKQDFTIFDELIQWDKEAGFRTALVQAVEGNPAAKASTSFVPDAEVISERVARAAQALGTYSGHDRFLMHLRDRLSAEGRSELGGDDAPPITRSNPVVLAELAQSAPSTVVPRLALAVALLAAALLVAALVMIYLGQ